eukprot:1026104-Pelagomonas_calceolata.AAC.4
MSPCLHTPGCLGPACQLCFLDPPACPLASPTAVVSCCCPLSVLAGTAAVLVQTARSCAAGAGAGATAAAGGGDGAGVGWADWALAQSTLRLLKEIIDPSKILGRSAGRLL